MLDPFVQPGNQHRRLVRQRYRIREPIRQRTKVRSKRGPDDQRSQRLRKQALDVL